MSRSHSAVIDLTEESPPARAHTRPPTLSTDTHILDWSSSTRSDRPSTHSATPSLASSSSGSGPSNQVSAPIQVDSDDEDGDNSFIITGQSRPVRSSDSLQRSSSSATAFHRPPAARSASASSVRIHDGIVRGPHGSGSRIPQSTGVLSSSSSARHPFLPQRRPAVSSTTTIPARQSGGSTPTGSDNLFTRLTGELPFGGFGAGASYTDMLSSLMRSFHSNRHCQHSAERKVPQEYDPKWTHPYEPVPGFTHNIIEPPVDLDTYFDDKAVVTGPLPETTPICPCCRHALVTGANGDQRIWVLPCGHVIDGRCVDQLSGLTPLPPPPSIEADHVRGAPNKGKGKAKATEAARDEPLAKVSRTSARSRATASIAQPTNLTPNKPKKPKRFECPVKGCGQKCSKEPGSKFSAWEVFV